MRRWQAVLVVLVVLVGLDTATLVQRSDRPSRHAAPGHAEATRSVTASAAATAVAALLRERAAAIERRDLAGFTALLDPAAASFVSTQRSAFTAMTQVPMTDVGYTADAASAVARGRPARYGGLPTYAPTVTLSYEIDGFDAAPVRASEVDTFVERTGRWLLASDTDFGQPAPEIWQYGPLQVVRGAHCLVVAGPGMAEAARAVAAEADRDVATVTAVWGEDWARRAVVLLPSTQAQLAALLDAHGDLSQIAAVESTELGQRAPSGARILVNPQPYASLSPLGRQVVITHELAHVASRASTSETSPLWLVEGFADYVGFSRTGLSPVTAAAEVAARMRAGSVPTALPDDAAFRADAPNLAAQYEEAWLACRLVAGRIGAAGLVGLYRAVGASHAVPAVAVDAALRDRLGEGTAAFTRDWLDYLRQQLSP